MSQLTGPPGPRPTGPRRRRWVLPVLLVLLIGVPLIEVWLLVQVSHRIGVGWTLLILIAEAAFGAWLSRREGLRSWRALQKTFRSGRMPTGELANAALVLVGGCLLIFPGFFTDVFGLICLLPFTRPLARRLLVAVVAGRVRRAGVDVDVIRAHVDRDNNIEGEASPADGPGRQPDPRSDRGAPRGSTPGRSDPTVIRGEVED